VEAELQVPADLVREDHVMCQSCGTIVRGTVDEQGPHQAVIRCEAWLGWTSRIPDADWTRYVQERARLAEQKADPLGLCTHCRQMVRLRPRRGGRGEGLIAVPHTRPPQGRERTPKDCPGSRQALEPSPAPTVAPTPEIPMEATAPDTTTKGRGRKPKASAPAPAPAETLPVRDPRDAPRPHDVLLGDDGRVVVVVGYRIDSAGTTWISTVALVPGGTRETRTLNAEAWRGEQHACPDEVILQTAIPDPDHQGAWVPPADGYDFQLPLGARNGRGFPRAPDGLLPVGHRSTDRQEAAAAAPARPSSGRRTVKVCDLVLDVALQCRVAIDQATVDEYAEAFKGGATFPALSLVQVGEELLVVDGWHRAKAARQAGVKELEADVAVGTRRDAMLAAVRANATHGLRRTQADKRRAVQVLLLDAEWCRQSSRDLGALAGVSHAYVNLERGRYGVKVGEVLRDDRREEVDGEMSPSWKDLYSRIGSYGHKDLDKVRVARTPSELAKACAKVERFTSDERVSQLRLAALVEADPQPWPWPEDHSKTELASRVKALDTVEDMERALVAEDCPDRPALWKAYTTARSIPRMKDSWQIKRALEIVAGRPALEAAVAEKLGAKGEEETERPWEVARQIMAMRSPTKKAEALGSVTAELLAYINADRCLAPGAFAALRGAWDRHGVTPTTPCPDPDCAGFVAHQRYQANCVLCSACARDGAEGWSSQAQRALILSGRLLRHEGYGLVVEMDDALGIVVDVHALRVLRAMVRAREQAPIAFAEAVSPEVLEAWEAWEAAPEPALLGRQPGKAADEVSEQDDDAGVESDGDQGEE